VERALRQWTLPVRTQRLGGAETSLDIKYGAIAHQQDRSRRHLTDTEFVLLELCSLASRAGCDCRLHIRIRNRVCGATKPVVEPYFAEPRFVAGEEGAFIELSAEVASVCVCDHFASIVAGAKDALEQSVEVERFGPADFNGAIQGRACRDLRDRACDIVS